MPVEVTTNIPGLNQSYPLATDGLGEGDDHLRLIKRVLKTTFPNIDQPITVSAAAINAVISNPFPFPVGGIILWSGTVASIPTGWTLCNGVTVNKSDGTGTITPPDLRDRFVIAAGGSFNPNATGGTSTHSHTATASGTALSVAQLPAHSHAVSDPGHSHGVYDPGHSHSYSLKVSDRTGAGDGFIVGPNTAGSWGFNTSAVGTGISIYNAGTGVSIQNTGSGQTHTHTVSVTDGTHIPPYYALAYIMKI